MSEFEVKARVLGLPELQAKLAQLGEAAAGDALEQAGRAGGLVIQNAAKVKAPKRTRTLSRSIHLETAEKRASYVEVVIGTDLEYAAVQEFGGTITPKGKQFLAIPLTEQARQYVSPKTWPGRLKAVMGTSGGVLVDESDVAQYALSRSVTVPAQPYLRPALDENAEAATAEAGRVLQMLIERAAG